MDLETNLGCCLCSGPVLSTPELDIKDIHETLNDTEFR